MTHVFVVDKTTFNIHLQYMFAGTGFSTFQPLLYSTTANKYANEDTFTGMIADISKVRNGDKVLFYVTGIKKFFGIFEIDSSPFFEPQSTNYLGTQLNKYLPFRVKIKPHKVYAKGILEQLALDDISKINAPYEMCWSMIYRKLTGMRGCSFVTNYEMNRLENLLDIENASSYLHGNDFLFDSNNGIILNSNTQMVYQGATTNTLSINNRLYHVKNSHEGHVQAYIIQNYDTDAQLKSKLLPSNFVNSWIGNEVVCSVGEKRIDILTIIETENEFQIRVIELKDEHPRASLVTDQIPWYIKWVDQYVATNLLAHNKPVKIIPTIFSYRYSRNTKNKRAFDLAVVNFNSQVLGMCKNATVLNIDCIYYDRSQNPIKIY